MHDVELILDPGPGGFSRRSFIKGIIAAGAGAHSSATSSVPARSWPPDHRRRARSNAW